jgi:hypothetical protein
MITIVEGEQVARYVASRNHADMFAEPYRAIGFAEDGEFKGGVVFNSYNGRDAEISVANDITRWPISFYRFFADYMWQTLALHRVTMAVRPGTERMCVQLGAKLEGVKREFYPDGGDQLLFGLLKSEFKLKP